MIGEKGIEVISFATNDHLENKTVQRKIHKRSIRVKYLVRAFWGINTRSAQTYGKTNVW